MLSCSPNHFFLNYCFNIKYRYFMIFIDPLVRARWRCNVGAICPIKSGTGTQKIFFYFFFIITMKKTLLIVFMSF